MEVQLENKVHGTSTKISIREDIIQPGVFKDIKKKLCKCNGLCGCSSLGHTHSDKHICTCKDSMGEEYGLVLREETDENIDTSKE